MKINIGAGSCPLEGYLNIDRSTGGEAYPLMQNGVVFETGVADEIRASHVLEHFSHRDTLNVLKEWVRVLKPGGLLKIAVPNFEYAASQMGKHDHAPMWIMGGHVDSNDQHGAIFTHAILQRLMKEAGIHFSLHRIWDSEQKDCASLPVSLNLYGTKAKDCVDVPKPEVRKRRKILGIMSCPRVGFLHTHGCIETIFSTYGISMSMYFGAFWEQGIQCAIEKAIEDGYDDVITLDYDSVFNQEQFERMISYWLHNPTVDALSCLQPQRGSGMAMLTPAGKGEGTQSLEIKLADAGIPARTAHFGLTFLRLNKCAAMPKPWFHSQPSPKGEWKKDGAVDADIYFWRKWEANGNTLEILPDVLLGHIEILIGQISMKTGKATYRHVSDWNADPFKGLTADAQEKKEEKKPDIDPALLEYDAMKVYNPNEDFSADTYPVSFHQRGATCLGKPSTDLSGSSFQNVSGE